MTAPQNPTSGENPTSESPDLEGSAPPPKNAGPREGAAPPPVRSRSRGVDGPPRDKDGEDQR